MSTPIDHSGARETLAFPALEVENTSPPDRINSPFWSRPSTYRRSTSFTSSQRQPASRTWYGRAVRHYKRIDRNARKQINRLTPIQQGIAVIVGIVTIVLGVLLLVYNERIFAALEPWAKKWRDLPAGWLILWAATFVVSFPPLIGYSSCVTLSGFIWGFPYG
jgi:hypothetical protein